jgi:hypothetical protein
MDFATQFYAAFAAPIPFFLALLGVGAVIWSAVKWAYDTRLDKAKFHIEMAKLDADRFKLREAELTSENQVKTDKIAELEKEKASLSEAGQKALAELADSTERTDQTLEELGDTSDALETNLDSASTGGLLVGEVARARRVARRQRKIERQKARREKRIGLDNTGRGN